MASPKHERAVSEDPPYWISPPRLSNTEDYKYMGPLPVLQKKSKKEVIEIIDDEDKDEDKDDSSNLVEILGETMEGRQMYYFVETSGRWIEKHSKAFINDQDALLVYSYDQKKRKGTLKPFDTSDPRIRPKDRVKVKHTSNPLLFKIDTRRVHNLSRGQRAPPSKDYDEDDTPSDASSSEESGSGDAAEGEDGAEYGKQPTRRSKRIGAARTIGADRPAPSPRKMRMNSRSMATRVSTRQTRGRGATQASSDEDMYDEEEIPAAIATPPPKSRKAKTAKAPPILQLGAIYSWKDVEPESTIALTDQLRVHREECEKCRQGPAHLINPKRRKKAKRMRGKYDEDSDMDEKSPEELGGWLKCIRCSVAGHWSCVSANQRAQVVAAVRAKGDDATWQKLPIGEIGTFVCGSCARGGACMGCKETAGHIEGKAKELAVPLEAMKIVDSEGDVQMDGTAEIPTKVADVHPAPDALPPEPLPLLFRCTRCKRPAHYKCLPNPPPSFGVNDEPLELDELAAHYQETWECSDCSRWRYPLEHILAWRHPSDAEGNGPASSSELVDYKAALKKEYLIKWQGRCYKRCEWVPHAWLITVNGMKVKNFLEGGRKVELLAGSGGVEGEAVIYEGDAVGAPEAEPDAERKIPEAWKKVDRLLDVKFWIPLEPPSKKPKRGGRSKGRLADPEPDSEEEQSKFEEEKAAQMLDRKEIMKAGEEPDGDEELETADQRCRRTGEDLSADDMGDIAWCFIKWEDLGYEQSTWDSPLSPQGLIHEGMEKAFASFIDRRKIITLSLGDRAKLDRLNRQGKAKPVPERPEFGQQGELFPFQVAGVKWLYSQWRDERPAILADEMGLGKTVQIITFLAHIFEKHKVYPILVVVPNSTITNWIREFARWAPRMHVVPFLGEAESRRIIREFELFPSGTGGKKGGMKAHVLVTTYEAITNVKDSTNVFKAVPKWEVLIVDESQRLKSDSSLIFKRLSELDSKHRVLMTGTPLNNNMRELFNLMHFLDPEKWRNAAELEKQYEDLTEERLKHLHERLKAYFLRRTKEEQLDLPPKNEVIVPVSMSTLQKEVYRSLLSRNAGLIGSLVQSSTAKMATKVKKGSLNNLLMELRKCLQHPYLVSQDLEPSNLSPSEQHNVFVDASAKLKFLQVMLPKLKERGHRVLLFSQFVIALNIVEDFLVGEGFKFVRLDGNTKQAERQKQMDQFNRPGSDIFIYLLSTRAGGVGINLTSADTVIILDPDFNPHQDLQAIARAHRIGQTKPVLVFKLMTKSSAEEKIIQVGKGKLALDHLIVQRLDMEGEEPVSDVQSVLSYGAQALFAEEASGVSNDITYSDQDIDALILKTETEGAEATNEKQAKKKGMSFDFAKIWELDKNTLGDVPDDKADNAAELEDFWASVASRAQADQAKRESHVKMGRGVRRAAAAAMSYTQVPPDLSAIKGAIKGAPVDDEESDEATDPEFVMSDDHSSDNDDEAGVLAALELDDLAPVEKIKRSRKGALLADNQVQRQDSQALQAQESSWIGPTIRSVEGISSPDVSYGDQVLQQSLPTGIVISRLPLQPHPLHENSSLQSPASLDSVAKPLRGPKSDGKRLANGASENLPPKRARSPEMIEYEVPTGLHRCKICTLEHLPNDCPGLQNYDQLVKIRADFMELDDPDDSNIAAAIAAINDRLANIERLRKEEADRANAAAVIRPIKKRKSRVNEEPRIVPVFDRKSVGNSTPSHPAQSSSKSAPKLSPSHPTGKIGPPSATAIKPYTPKRVAPPRLVGRTSVSAKVSGDAESCPLCGEMHPLKACPKLKRPLEMKRAIQALSEVEGNETHIVNLKMLLWERHRLIVGDLSHPSSEQTSAAGPSRGRISSTVGVTNSPLARRAAHPYDERRLAIAGNAMDDEDLPLCRLCNQGHHPVRDCPAVSTYDLVTVKSLSRKLKKRPTETIREDMEVIEALKVLTTRRKDLHVEQKAANKANNAENPIEISD